MSFFGIIMIMIIMIDFNEREEAGMTIGDLRKGDAFTVRYVTLRGEVGKRLADMGFTEGAEGTMVRSALFGDPVQVKIRGYDISLRRSEAAGILVKDAV
jgi:Fe2+ transport system protein FeoA